MGTLGADCAGAFGTTLGTTCGSGCGSGVDATLGTEGWIGGAGSSTLGASCAVDDTEAVC